MLSKVAATILNELGCKKMNYILYSNNFQIGETQQTIGRHITTRKISLPSLNYKGSTLAEMIEASSSGSGFQTVWSDYRPPFSVTLCPPLA